MADLKATLGFIGAGATGTALACSLYPKGYNVVAVNSRGPDSAARLASRVGGCRVCITPQQVADLAQAVFITTPDDIIETIAANLAWRPCQVVIHCSGVHSVDILEHAHKYGAYICCLHPLQTFAGVEDAVSNIAGSTFALEGDPEALDLAGCMAADLDGRLLTLRPGDKVLYHASAVTLSNYLVTLMKTAAGYWESFGISRDKAVEFLLPLLKGTVRNIERSGVPDALTGPIARGDVETVRKHIACLEASHPETLDMYRTLGLETVSVALARGRLSLETAQEIRDLLGAPRHAGRQREIQAELSSDDINDLMYRH